MIHPQLPHTLTTLDQLFRVADAHLEALPDVLPWACLAAGALTECEHEESQELREGDLDVSVFEWAPSFGLL